MPPGRSRQRHTRTRPNRPGWPLPVSKALLLAFVSALLIAQSATADTIPPLSNSSWAASGAAEIYDPPKAIGRLTPNEGGAAGSVLYRSAISPSHLTVSFDESMTCGEESCNGADGMAFDILNASGIGAPPPVGGDGGALGFYPNKGIAVTLTQNSTPWGCYVADHFIGIADSEPPTECPLHYLAEAEVPPFHNAFNQVVMELDWPTETINVSINGMPSLSYVLPPFLPLPPSVYIGFSAGTGNGAEEHRVEQVTGTYTSFVGPPAPSPPSETPSAPPPPETSPPDGWLHPIATCTHRAETKHGVDKAQFASCLRLAGKTEGNIGNPKGDPYVPQIGVLVYEDPRTPPHNSHRLGSCTATALRSKTHEIILTAGHCAFGNVDSPQTAHHYYTNFAFAPGYVGPLAGYDGPLNGGPFPQCHTQATAPDAQFNCGVTPYGVWHAKRVALKAPWLEDEGNFDYAYLLMESNKHNTMEQAVGGGLSVDFGRSKRSEKWAAYGQPQSSTHMLHCGPANVTEYNFDSDRFGQDGPSGMAFRCPAMTGGASGGPWINEHGQVGAVNKAEGVIGTYLGNDGSRDNGAQQLFQAIDR